MHCAQAPTWTAAAQERSGQTNAEPASGDAETAADVDCGVSVGVASGAEFVRLLFGPSEQATHRIVTASNKRGKARNPLTALTARTLTMKPPLSQRDLLVAAPQPSHRMRRTPITPVG
jgi:hypothetical protein